MLKDWIWKHLTNSAQNLEREKSEEKQFGSVEQGKLTFYNPAGKCKACIEIVNRFSDLPGHWSHLVKFFVACRYGKKKQVGQVSENLAWWGNNIHLLKHVLSFPKIFIHLIMPGKIFWISKQLDSFLSAIWKGLVCCSLRIFMGLLCHWTIFMNSKSEIKSGK